MASPARAGMYRATAGSCGVRRGFPRTRGDVPTTTARLEALAPLPPHARGCTPCWHRRGRAARASPARAGMYPSYRYTHQERARFPRTRGDVPSLCRLTGGSGALPPHARGCTDSAPDLPDVQAASPARAGMYPGPTRYRRRPLRFPRTRGDVPTVQAHSSGTVMLPPHARGCTPRPLAQPSVFGASPARAGMYPASSRRWRTPPRFPRTRGDVPKDALREIDTRELPPHARGCTDRLEVVGLHPAASPARAGMYLVEEAVVGVEQRFPRTRGDVPAIYPRSNSADRLPPHARGCTFRRLRRRRRHLASPARAGMYRIPAAGRCPRAGFPRTRGDVPRRSLRRDLHRPLPPHARGCTPARPPRRGSRPASPARAGMYRRPVASGARWGCFPRTRGDVPSRRPG